MADWFVGPVMEKLIDTCFDYLRDRYFGGRTGTKEALERLRAIHPLIKSVVSDYTQGSITNPDLNNWLWQLRDAIDEADDVLDDLKYMKLKEQLELNMEETKVRSSLTTLFFKPARKFGRVCERALKSDPNLEKLEDAVQKLERVSAQVNTFIHLVEKKEKERQVKDQQLCNDRASGSFPGLVFIGRDQPKKDVMDWLRKPSNHNLSLLSIVGHGGMGKTTLLQNIYADAITKEFDLKIWVSVSNNFKVEEVITNMLNDLDKGSSHLTELSSLQKRLESVTQSQKFLIVLDDIWEETTTTNWEKVISPLANGKLGSKILVTTRTHAAASMIPGINVENRKTLTLEGLEEAQCLELLNTRAFYLKENFKENKKLICITEEIVKRLSGCPLAAKVIGGVLNIDVNETFWTNILNSTDVLNVGPEWGRSNILSILRLSLTFLSQPQQNCFGFCGLFPQDHKFDKNDLVRMWIALGFIQESSIQGETLEDIGGRYFDVLVRRSFFDEFQYHNFITYNIHGEFQNKRIYYKMHDLLHDLSRSISSEECFGFVGDDVLSFKIPKNVRHLFVKGGNSEMLRMIKDVKNLHSLFLISERGCAPDFSEVFTESFKASRSIRVLFIDSQYPLTMSKAIKKLRHLRYLNLSGSLTQMPRSLSRLYHLRFIIFKNGDRRSCSDDFLPGDVTNLSNLRHLELPPNVISSVPGIGKLRSLQELNEFYVKNENGYRIGELEHMSHLRKLKMHFLENVKDVREARNAKLFEKRKLTHLFLDMGKLWKSYREAGSSDLDVNVLENLKPYKNLKSLDIVSYEGARSAKWMYDPDWISNLEHICLEKCSEWETLPPFGQLPHLKSLYLRDMPKAKRLDYKFHGNDKVSVFPSLEVLYMAGLEVLEDWFGGEGAAAFECFFPCLTELILILCPNLQELPYLPPKLKKKRMDGIGWKALNCKQGTSKSIPLETLEVSSCPNITSLLPADVRLEALRKLSIEDCPNLISLGGLLQVESGAETSLHELSFKNLESLQSLPSSLECHSSLKILRVENVPQLQQLPQMPASLRLLYLEYLESLQCLPTSLSTISSLKNLLLRSIPLLESLPDLPSSLYSIKIENCDNLQCLPSSFSAISSLKELELDNIPLLKSLPELPSSLYELTLHELDNLECLPSSLSTISSLKKLYLKSSPLLKSLPDLPPSLYSLYLWNLDNLECLPFSLSALSSLDSLDLENIPLLESLPELPPSLTSLSLRSLDKLECLPSSLSAISSLNDLKLESIPLLKSLPDLPSSLKVIRVIHCHPELMKRYEVHTGSDWHKIAHIPNVCIGSI